jgi:acetyl-CoA carboxylase biotin carboxyl carrier protein
MSQAEIDPKVLKELLEAFEASDWDELSLTLADGDSLHLSRDPDSAGLLPAAPAPPAPPAAPGPSVGSSGPAPAPAGAAPEPTSTPPADAAAATGVPVASTTVGIFWVAPAPGAPPFVEVGSRVGAGDTVGIVEVMKLMNHIPAGVEGVVTAVLVGNGEPVEFGQPLVMIDPEG